AVQARGQDEMAFEQRPGGAELVQHLLTRHAPCSFNAGSLGSVSGSAGSSPSQPFSRSTEAIEGEARSAAMIPVRCFTSRTSMSTMTSKKSTARLVILRFEMLARFLAITVH